MRDLKRSTFDCPICKSNLSKRDIKIEKKIKNIVDYFKEIKQKQDHKVLNLNSQINKIITNENSSKSKLITDSNLSYNAHFLFFFRKSVY